VDTPSSPEPAAPRRAPAPLLVAAAGVALEGLGVIGYGVAEALHTTAARATMGASTALFLVAVGAGLVFCASALVRVRSWGRGPVLLAQLMALGLAWSFRGGSTWGIAIALLVPAVVVLVAMLQPSTLRALEGGPGPD
jgi:hypothetical protein